MESALVTGLLKMAFDAGGKNNAQNRSKKF